MGLIQVPPPNVSGANFALPVWVTGAPPANDSAPTNLASVPEARRVLAIPFPGVIPVSGSGNVRAVVIGGTSASLATWYYDATMAKWVQLATTTVNSGTGPFTASVVMPYGALIYVQIVSTSGAVTAVGYGFN
jgi:hypothetical protein